MAKKHGKLAGRRVVITGVSRGVGLAVAKKFLAEGAQVLGVARNRTNLRRADRELKRYGRAYSSLLLSVTSLSAGPRIRAAAARRWKGLDILLNNAGVNIGGKSFEHEGLRGLVRTLRVNLLAPHRLSLALLPLLRKGKKPRIINVSSGAGSLASVRTSKSMDSYRLSKYALDGLTMIFASQLKGRISVVSMDPGWVKTDMGGKDAPETTDLSAQRALEIALLPARVTGTYQIGKKTVRFR